MVEIDEEYCLYAQKRLQIAERDPTIQGYYGQVFWERNTLREIKSINKRKHSGSDEMILFINNEKKDR